jgi:hypothetical protein
LSLIAEPESLIHLFLSQSLEKPADHIIILGYLFFDASVFITMFKLTYLIALILLLLPKFSLLAQETTAEISGIIKENVLPVSDVAITATHLPTGTKYVTVSRQDGRYNLPNLKIGGPYSVVVSFVGYKQMKKDSITLIVGEEYNLNFAMTPESKILDNVIVHATMQGKVFNANHAGPEEVVNRDEMMDLPTANATLKNLSELFPSNYNFNIAGRNGLYNTITLDAANFTSVFGLVSDKRAHISGQPLSIESVEQMQVNVAPYDVIMGGFAGTNINVVSRSGTNHFKGSVYSYASTPGLTGYKVGSVELPKEEFTYNRTGFFISGPIKTDKLFFFINGEHENFSTPATTFIASDSAHQPGDNVSFASADELSKLRQFLIDKFNYDPGAYQNYYYRNNKDKLSIKLDWNVGFNTTLSVKYNFYTAIKDEQVNNNGAPGRFRQPGYTGMPFSGTGYTVHNNMNNIIAELNTNWKGDAANKLQVGYLGFRNYQESIAKQIFPLVDIVDQQNQFYTSFGLDPYSYNNQVHIDIFQFADILTMYKGSHEITLGTQDYIKHYKSGFAPFYAGYYRFKTLDSFYSNVENSVTNAPIYTLSYSVLPDHSFPFTKVGVNELSFFAQDKIRFNNKFVLTYGVRFDAPFFEDEFPDNENVKNLPFRDGKHYDVGEKPSTNMLISPRVSFNWDMTKNVRTQVRGGAGLFSGPPPLLWLSNIASNNGAQLNTVTKNKIIFSNDITHYIPSTLTPDTSYDLALIDKDFKYPQVLKTNIAIDRVLPGNITATFEAMYAKDIVSIYFQNVNLPSYGKPLNGADNRIRYSGTQINKGGDSATPENPDIGNAILMTNSNKGYAYSFTLQLQKRINNFYFGASYAFTKAKTLNDGGALQPSMWSNRPVTGDPNAAELGYADFYQPHRVFAYGSYRKEYGKHFATAISFIFEAGPSGAGSYTYQGDLNNDGTLNNNNDLIYIPKNKEDIVLVPVNTSLGDPYVTDKRTPDQIWAQLDAFIMQDKYLSSHRGQYAERNAVVFPFFKRLDLNVSQEFMFGKHTIRLTADIINIGNLLNKYWGTYQVFTTDPINTPYISSILKFEDIDASGKPRFSFPYLDPVNEIPLTKSFTDDLSIYSRWQLQFGIRYTFQ